MIRTSSVLHEAQMSYRKSIQKLDAEIEGATGDYLVALINAQSCLLHECSIFYSNLSSDDIYNLIETYNIELNNPHISTDEEDK